MNCSYLSPTTFVCLTDYKAHFGVWGMVRGSSLTLPNVLEGPQHVVDVFFRSGDKNILYEKKLKGSGVQLTLPLILPTQIACMPKFSLQNFLIPYILFFGVKSN